MSANAVPRQRRKGFAALGISVLNSDVSQDQKDIKFRSHGRGRDSEHDMDLQAEILKGKSRDQDRLLAIVAGLQEGIEDLLAGRVFHPKQEEEEECPRMASSGSSSDGQNEKVPSPTEEAKQEASAQSGQEAATRENKEAVPVSLKKSLAGMPIWIEHEVHSDDEDSNAGSAEQGASDDESVGSFLHIAQHDIDDLVQETDEKKLEQQIGWGRAATNRIMYEWKEYARVKIMEEVNQWFQHRSWAAREEAEMLDEAEATSREILASEHESIRALKTAIERKEIALVSSVSSFRQNMDRRVEQHWAAKRRARDQAIAQVQREEEQRRQERLRRQQERAAKKFSDIDDQIADIKDSIEQVKGEIHKKELMKHTYPSGKRRASAAGGAKAGDVLAIIASQQEEAQVLSGKLALENQKLETLEEALEKGRVFFNSQGFKSKKVRSLPADDPAGEIVNEEMTSAMKTVLAQLMIEDESLAELISIAISLANSPAGKNRTRNGFLRLDDIFGEKDPLAADDPNKLPADEIVVSKDPEERKRKLKEIQTECAQLQEDIEILDSVDHIMPDSPADAQVQDDDEQLNEEEAELRRKNEKALEKLLTKALAAMDAMHQKKAVLTQSRKPKTHEPSDNPEIGSLEGESRGGEATEEEDAKNIGRDPPKEKDAASLLQSEEHTEAEKEAEKQKVVAAQLSEEEAALKRQLKQLRAIESKAAGGSPQGSPGHGFAPDPQVAGGSPRSKAERLEASRNPSWRRVNQTDGTVQRDDGVHSESDVSIVEETPDVGELLQPGAGTDMGPTAGGDSSADDSGSASSATNEVKVRRHASVTRQEADHLDDALAKQLEENKVAAQEVEELRQLLETLKNAPVPLAQGTSAAKQESSGPKGEGILPKPIDRDQSGAVTPGSRSQVQLEPVSSPSGSPSRGSKSRRSLAPCRGSVEKPQEETEEQKDQSALKLHELVSACQQLAAEKEGYEKEMASIEEKIRRVKSMDSGGVVELLKKDVQSEKKVDSIEVKELKAEIKKRQSQVNAMRRTWQDMQLSGNRRNALSGAEDEERQRDVAKRFAHVLSFLRASKASELTQEAKKAGLVTESGNAEVVGKTASKFLSAIRKVRVAERPVQDDDGEEGDVPPSPGDGRTPAGSPTGTSPAASRQGFNRLTAEATTGHRGQNLEVPQGQSGQDRVPSPRLPRRASLPLKAPEDEPDTRRRRSFNNILEKAKMKKPKEDNVATPGAKVNSAVRFAPEDAQETPRLRSKSHN